MRVVLVLIAWLMASPALANPYVEKLRGAIALPDAAAVEPAVAGLRDEAQAAGEAKEF